VVSLRRDGVRGRAAARQLCRVKNLELMPRMRYTLWFEEAVRSLSSCLRGNCVDHVNHVVMSGQSVRPGCFSLWSI
jgi:hypothetical protein